MQRGEKLTLRVKKRTPSLNTLLRLNRWERLAEKSDTNRAVLLAIESALLAEGSDSATPTTSLGASSISSIRSGLRKLFQKTTPKTSSWKSRKKKSVRTKTKKRGWR